MGAPNFHSWATVYQVNVLARTVELDCPGRGALPGFLVWLWFCFEAGMTQATSLYRPSLLELAREGNFRAIAYWINSLLAPYGMVVRATASRSGRLNILIDFRQPYPREFYLGLRGQLIQFICYRLWTLNSAAIRDVRIVARMAGEPNVLWQKAVRINTLANTDRPTGRSYLSRTSRSRSSLYGKQRLSWSTFQILRSFLLSRFAIAGFFLCYWLLYWKLSGYPVIEHAQDLPAAAIQTPQTLVASSVNVSLSGNSIIPDLTPGLIRNRPLLNVTIPPAFQGQIVHQVSLTGGEKLIALTFDDGPWPETTEQILDILQQANIRATFFMVGLHVQNHPEIAKKVAEAGHAIGNHTWRHLMQNLDAPTAVEEISNAARLIYEATGVKTQLLRPPGGNLSGELVPHAQQNSYAITLWSADSEDYYVASPLIVDNILRNAQPGGILLLHDGGGNRAATVQALPQIISALQQQGYRFVTIPELMEAKVKNRLTRSFN